MSKVLHTELETDKKSLEANVAELDAMFASIGSGAIATNAEGKIMRINDIALGLLAYTKDNALGEWYPKIIQAETEDGKKINQIELPITKSLITGVAVTERVVYVSSKGNKIPVSVTVSPIVLDDRPIGAIEVFRDITEELEIERAKSEFISLATHQLKSPPGAIRWNLEVLLDGSLGDLNADQKEMVSTSMQLTTKMIETVNALLNVSRMELNTFMIDPVPVDFEDIIKLLLTEQDQKIKAKKLKIVENYEKGIPKIPADPGLAKIIVENVVSNAIKYTPEEGTVTIKIDNNKKEKHILLSVKDTGYGIPKSQQDKIFTKMFRAENIREKAEGTGLGLYLLKSIVEFSDGKVWFESIEGKGTTFFVELPHKGMEAKEGTSKMS